MTEEVIKNNKTRRKREKPEDFIGWKSQDELLEVVELLEKSKNSKFKVICHKCKHDKELFPEGYFVSMKHNLLNGVKPCGCAFNPKWNKEQFLVLARRAAQERFIVHGFAEAFRGACTKLNLECLIDGYKWTTSTHSVINGISGCPKCGGNARPTEQEVLGKCKELCENERYEPLGFPSGYKNAFSRFEYKCQKHGIQSVSYDNFVNKGTRCKGCWKERQKELGNNYGYYPERSTEKDFLYVLNFNDKFIKVGRSFDVNERMKGLRTESKVPIKKIHKLRIFTATHQEIYDTEQELHIELRERNFQHYVDWSTECFENDCLFILNKLLDHFDLKEVI